MLRAIVIYVLIVTSAQGQLNGEFWWLNSKLNTLKNVNPSPPKIDNSEFQNDESSKIIFRDDDWFTNKLKPIKDRTSKIMPSNNSDEHKVVWPKEEHMKSHDVEVLTNQNVNKQQDIAKPKKIKNKIEDVLVFSYPKNEKFVTVDSNKAENVSEFITSISTESNKEVTQRPSIEISFTSYKLPTMTTIISKDQGSQNICTYTTKTKCNLLNGFVYEYARRVPNISGGEPLICCILPIQPIINQNNLSHTIHFPRMTNRYKRSERDTAAIKDQKGIALKQRDFLLKRKFSSHQQQNERPDATPLTKIVSPPEDDYVDPYSNIKNTKVLSKPNLGSTKYVDYSEESPEYADEIPKPGLVGLYSDHAPSPSNWHFANENKGVSYAGSDYDYESDEDEDETFGYSTIDPRQGTKKQRQKLKPGKLTTTSDDLAYDAERHTINFHSNPDFQVFQGFKLLNLFRNTSRVYTKKTPDQDTDVLVGSPDNSEEIEETFDEEQLFEGCGNRVPINKINERGNQIGEAVSGSSPWLALVVLTKSRHNVLCYATLVHPRAAITVADCTQGTAPGDITVIFGLWDLNNRSRSKSRIATVHVHPRYKPGGVENNLAILYWMQPLKLSINIQPSCLGQPEIGEECTFFGWGRLDQGIQQSRPRWQRATIRTCSNRLGINQRTRSQGDAFCVSAQRGTVTGLGGPLICDNAGRSTIVGVVVSRDNGYVLSPVRDWTMKMDSLVSGD